MSQCEDRIQKDLWIKPFTSSSSMPSVCPRRSSFLSMHWNFYLSYCPFGRQYSLCQVPNHSIFLAQDCNCVKTAGKSAHHPRSSVECGTDLAGVCTSVSIKCWDQRSESTGNSYTTQLVELVPSTGSRKIDALLWYGVNWGNAWQRWCIRHLSSKF